MFRLKGLLRLQCMLCLLFYHCVAISQPLQKIIIWKEVVDSPSNVVFTILTAALDETNDQYGPYDFVISVPMEQKRALHKLTLIDENRLDIAHFAATKAREKQAIAIRVPLIDGMLGKRICLIKKGSQPKFSVIQNKQDLIDSNINFACTKAGQTHHFLEAMD